MDEVTIENYSKIMDEIVERTGGKFENMTLDDKLVTIHIMREIKKQMDEYYKTQYKIVCAWASMNMEDIILSEKECYVNKDLKYYRDMCLNL